MTFDLDIDDSKDAHLDDTNDLALTSGRDRVEQSTAIAVGDEITEFVGETITGPTIGFLEDAIRRGLQDDNDVSEVLSVTMESYNRDTGTVKASIVTVPGDEFVIEVTP